ncbi:type II 3-dehydroquinate dehydratase [Thalassobacillus sp. CUG 92003]|uniref:type II 3-dehydroquinate dehydratase n=1 Tax=Thalassobacillus sp. CUG 92003 TaxID=2736641 RepID=UPI0015E6B416|nr:type II 3-dehydroquinate dehydratase [Thalassobacillus sp. CUG 92003]
MKRLLLLNGPNLNLLGSREPGVYGSQTLESIINSVNESVEPHGFSIEHFQSNHEGELIDRLQQANGKVTGVVFNPGAYTHTSIALRDAIQAIDPPVIEVHLSNVHNRESFRHHSMLAPVCTGQIVGLGAKGYQLAAMALIDQQKS